MKNLCKCDSFVYYYESTSLTCYEDVDKTTVTFRGWFSDDSLYENVMTWVENTNEIVVFNTTLKLDANCAVKIDKIDDKSCDELSPNTGKQTGSKNTTAIAVPLVIILITAVVVLMLGAGFLYWRKRHGRYELCIF